MPLRAIVHGTEVIAPLLNQREWIDLQSHIKRDGWEVIMPCCGAHGFARTSKLGTPHFVHKEQIETCNSAPETWQHLLAKAEIVRVCRDNGYEAIPEASGDGWRADVLASKGQDKIVFETQWSRQTWEETIYRQSRYSADGIFAYWLFKTIPSGAFLDPSIPYMQIQFVNDKPYLSFLKYGNKHSIKSFSLRDAIAHLLKGHLQFREVMTFKAPPLLMSKCYSCHGTFAWIYGTTKLKSDCHKIIDLESRIEPNIELQFQFKSDDYPPPLVRLIDRQISSGVVRIARCPYCGVENLISKTRAIGQWHPTQFFEYSPHWCFSENGKHCHE